MYIRMIIMCYKLPNAHLFRLGEFPFTDRMGSHDRTAPLDPPLDHFLLRRLFAGLFMGGAIGGARGAMAPPIIWLGGHNVFGPPNILHWNLKS